MAEKQSTKTKGGVRENSGRPKGVPNKVTTEARELVKNILDANLPNIQSWLEATANGIRDENDKYLVMPNPAKACDIVQNLIEYSVPKLSRAEVVGENGGPMVIQIVRYANNNNSK
jgi:hypothetical protein